MSDEHRTHRDEVIEAVREKMRLAEETGWCTVSHHLLCSVMLELREPMITEMTVNGVRYVVVNKDWANRETEDDRK